MRTASLLGVTALLALAAPAAADEVPWTAVVVLNGAEVRAGPGEDDRMYVTNRLRAGELLEVLGPAEDPKWVRIRPPAGSYSLVMRRFIEPIGPGSPNNWMVSENATALVGTDIAKANPQAQIIGARLTKGAQVVSLRKEIVDPQGFSWVPIEPPPAEVRYIRADALKKADVAALPPGGSTAAKPPVPGAPGGESVEALWHQAQLAEQRGNIPEAIDLYSRVSSLSQASNRELAAQALNRATFLRQQGQVYSTQVTPGTPPTGRPFVTTSASIPATAPGAPGIRLAEPVGVTGAASAAPGPPASARSSGPGYLRRAGRILENRRTYVLQAPDGRPLFYVTPEPGIDLEPYLNHAVELYGPAIYSGDLRANYMRVERVYPLPS